MKKRSASEMLDDAREELVSLRTVPDGGEGHTKEDELKMGNKRAGRLLASVTPELISVIGAVSLGANMAAYTKGFKLSLKSITCILESETPTWEVVRMYLMENEEFATLCAKVTSPKHVQVLVDAVVIAATLRREQIVQHIARTAEQGGI